MTIRNILKLAFFGASLLWLYHLTTTSNPQIRGDGREYILMTQSFLNHSSPDLRKDDAKDVFDAFKKNNPKFLDHSFNCNSNEDCGISTLIGRGYFSDKHNKLYSYHFSFYSLLNIPANIITNNLSKPPTVSFYLTNSFFFIMAIYFVLFFLDERVLYKGIILTLIISQTTFAYLKWPHPESITLSLMIISICLIKSNMLFLSSVIFAIASLQYQPLGIVSAIVLLYGFISELRDKKIWSINDIILNKKIIIKYISFAFISGTIVLIPSMFYLYHFSSPNIIASYGGTNASLISLSRLASLYFDINQGAILLYPIVIITVPLIFIYSIITIKNSSSKNALLFISISLISAIPCLATTNWNSGADNVMRYAFWVSLPLVFSFAEFILSIKNKIIFYIIILLAFLSHIFISLLQFNDKYFAKGHLSPSYVALAFYNHAPFMYNPEAEIFIDRSLSKESNLDGSYPGYVKRGYLKKLIAPENISVERLNPCKGLFPKIDKASDGYVYYNYDNDCKVAENTKTGVIMFSAKN